MKCDVDCRYQKCGYCIRHVPKGCQDRKVKERDAETSKAESPKTDGAQRETRST